MNAVTSGNLIISSDLNISEIQEFDMKIEKNCHTVARITGSVPDEAGESPVFQKLEGSSVTVSVADERGNKAVPPIFCGFIRNVEIWQEGNGYKARIEAISPTELLDLKEKSRSFQKIDMTYKELVRSVLSDTENADVIFQITVAFLWLQSSGKGFQHRRCCRCGRRRSRCCDFKRLGGRRSCHF